MTTQQNEYTALPRGIRRYRDLVGPGGGVILLLKVRQDFGCLPSPWHFWSITTHPLYRTERVVF